jgi:hypothetical protein
MKKNLLIVFVLVLCVTLSACGMGDAFKEGFERGYNEAMSQSETSEATENTTAKTTEDVESNSEPVVQRDNPLDSISLSVEDKREIYREYNAVLLDAYTNGEAASASSEEARQIEDNLAQAIGDNYGISYEDVEKIQMYGDMGYLYDYDPSTIELDHGELVSANITGTTLIVRVKISSSYSNKATIDQNYYNVVDLIENQGYDQIDLISYCAYADMTDGSEQKVVSFTVDNYLIQTIAQTTFPANTLGDYLDDLWVHQSLQ